MGRPNSTFARLSINFVAKPGRSNPLKNSREGWKGRSAAILMNVVLSCPSRLVGSHQGVKMSRFDRDLRSSIRQRLCEVAVSRGTLLSAKERFRVQVSYENCHDAVRMENRLLAELLTVHHLLADASILWHMEQKNLCMHHDMGHRVHMAADVSASGQHAQCGKGSRIYCRPVLQALKRLRNKSAGLRTGAYQCGFWNSLLAGAAEIRIWYRNDTGNDCRVIRYAETISNKDCKTPLDLMIKALSQGWVPIEKMPFSKTKSLCLWISTPLVRYPHTRTWPMVSLHRTGCRREWSELVNIDQIKLKPLEEKWLTLFSC